MARGGGGSWRPPAFAGILQAQMPSLSLPIPHSYFATLSFHSRFSVPEESANAPILAPVVTGMETHMDEGHCDFRAVGLCTALHRDTWVVTGEEMAYEEGHRGALRCAIGHLWCAIGHLWPGFKRTKGKREQGKVCSDLLLIVSTAPPLLDVGKMGLTKHAP